MDSLAPALIIAALMALPIVFLIVRGTRNLRERELAHKERMRALELGIDLPALEETPASGRNGKSKSSPGIHGIIWLGIGAGLVAARSIIGEGIGSRDSDDLYTFATFLMIWGVPAMFVGVGLIGYAVTMAMKNSGTGDNG